jgi:hypothetical protein
MSITAESKLTMDRRERLATNVSAATSVMKIANKSKLSVHVIIDNTDEVGTINVEVGNDGTHFNEVWYKDENEVLQTSGISVTSGTDINFLYDPLETNAKYLRVRYTSTSGGSASNYLNVYVNDSAR